MRPVLEEMQPPLLFLIRIVYDVDSIGSFIPQNNAFDVSI